MALDPQLKILLVEDAGTMRKMEARILAQVGFANIVEAVDGVDAEEKLRAHGDIGLIISDWSMPNRDGYQFLQWVRSQEAFRTVPFLMATGHGDKEYVARAMEAGANGVVAKPFTPDDLKTMIEEAFGQKKAVAARQETPRVNAQGKVHLRMAHIQITDHLALGVLRHQVESGRKTPAHFSLETRCLPGWNPVQSALENNEVDGAFILAPMAMDLFGYGVPIRLVLFAHRNGSICVRNKTGKYVKPYQQFFKHKTFYLPHKMSVHNMLAHMYFTGMGLRPGVAGKESVNVLFDVVPPVAMPEFLKENPDSSGFLVAEPIGSRAIAAGIAERQFLSSEVWPNHPCCVVVFRKEILDSHPEAVQEFISMLVEAGLFIRDQVEQAAEIAVDFLDPQRKLGLEPALLKAVLSDPQGITTDNLYPVLEDLETIQEYMTSRMEIGRRIDLAGFVDSRFADVACRNLPSAAGLGRPAKAGALTLAEGRSLASREGKYLIFTLGHERYGLGILDVREIIGLMAIHELPEMPPFYRGVINLRNKVIPVMDMRGKFGMESAEYDERTCIIVVEVSGKGGSRLMGIIVDAVSEVANVREQDVEDPPQFGSGVDTSFLLGMAKLSEGVTILLDIDALMQAQGAVSLTEVSEVF